MKRFIGFLAVFIINVAVVAVILAMVQDQTFIQSLCMGAIYIGLTMVTGVLIFIILSVIHSIYKKMIK